jgi:hypothetical protein
MSERQEGVVELTHPVMVGLGCGSGGVGWCGHLCPIWAESRSILLLFDVRPCDWVVEIMVLSKKRCRRAAPRVHREPPYSSTQMGVRGGLTVHPQAATPARSRRNQPLR